MQDVKLNGILKKLNEKDLITLDLAKEAQINLISNKKDFCLSDFIINNSSISDIEFAKESAKEFNLPFLDLDTIDLDDNKLIDEDIVKKYLVYPIQLEGKDIYLATSSPFQDNAIKEISFKYRFNVNLIIVEHNKLMDKINIFKKEDIDLGDMEDFDITFDEGDNVDENLDLTAISTTDGPITKFVNKMLLDAVNKKASDIHFEPFEKKFRVRFRIDGILTEVTTIPSSQSTTVAARLKVMANLDISERRAPQDGRVKMRISKTKSIDFRVSTLPTVYGEKIVLRILDGEAASFGVEAIEKLGYEENQKEMFLKALTRPQGMILVTGPTGSGKTVSLYTGLNILNTIEKNISTAEDPVEINVQGINQVQINPKSGLDFASALKSFLRQDPDIIMVGEIRDLETAAISIKAAQTGHLVLSTLHTNSAAETLSRLAQMGVPLFNVATAINLIIAQRLARRLCEHCKSEIEVPKSIFLKEGLSEQILADYSGKVYRANGCNKCTNGYKGRVGIYEVVPVSKEVSSMIMNEKNSLEIDNQMRIEGHYNLRQSALLKALSGIISMDEVYRVTSD